VTFPGEVAVDFLKSDFLRRPDFATGADKTGRRVDQDFKLSAGDDHGVAGCLDVMGIPPDHQEEVHFIGIVLVQGAEGVHTDVQRVEVHMDALNQSPEILEDGFEAVLKGIREGGAQVTRGTPGEQGFEGGVAQTPVGGRLRFKEQFPRQGNGLGGESFHDAGGASDDHLKMNLPGIPSVEHAGIRFRYPGEWQEFHHGFLDQTVVHQITGLVQNQKRIGPSLPRQRFIPDDTGFNDRALTPTETEELIADA